MSSDDARAKFKRYVNQLAQTRTNGNEKLLILKPKYKDSLHPPAPSPHHDPRNSLGIPVSPSFTGADFSPSVPRQPPPYRPPPPPTPSPNVSIDSVSLNASVGSEASSTPQAPPRRRSADKMRSTEAAARAESLENKVNGTDVDDGGDKLTVSVKERTQKFNRLASVEDELSTSPRQQQKEKERKKVGLVEKGWSVAS